MSMYRIAGMGDFLKHRSEFFTIDDFQDYKRARVQLHGRGIVERDTITGSQIRTKKQQAAKAGEFLVAEIDAKVGGFGIVPLELDGVIVSSHYFLFEIDESICLKQWLDYFVRSGLLTEQVAARGSTNYAAIRPHHVLDFEIPLPPLAEQRRIVGRIEALAGKVEEARRLRETAVNESNGILSLALSSVFDFFPGDELPSGWIWHSFDELLAGLDDGMRTGPFGTMLNKSEIIYEGIPILGIANVLANKFLPGFKDYVSFEKAKKLKQYELLPGDIVVARSGTVGRSCVIPEGIQPHPLMSTNLIRIRVNEGMILPELLSRLFNGSSLVERHKDQECRGSTRSFFTQKILSKLMIPTPPLREQVRILNKLHKLQVQVNMLQKLQGFTQKELDALLPSILDKAFKGEL